MFYNDEPRTVETIEKEELGRVNAHTRLRKSGTNRPVAVKSKAMLEKASPRKE